MLQKLTRGPEPGVKTDNVGPHLFDQSRRVRGSVTAEFAVVLPAVTALLAVLLFGAGAGILQLRLEEGARAGARAVARGENTTQSVDIATRLAGGSTTVVVDLAGAYATVTVSGRLEGPLVGMLAWQQSASAVARIENYDATVQRQRPGHG